MFWEHLLCATLHPLRTRSCSDCQVFGDRSMRKPFSGLHGPEIAGFYLEAGSGAARRLSQKALALQAEATELTKPDVWMCVCL